MGTKEGAREENLLNAVRAARLRTFDQFSEVSPERVALMRIVDLLEGIDKKLDQLLIGNVG